MSKKTVAAIVGAGTQAITKRWALDQGFDELRATAFAWMAGALASALVLRI